MRLSKAQAAVNRRDFLIPDNVKFVVPLVLNHRLVVAPESELEGVIVESISQENLNTIDTNVANTPVLDQ